MKNKRINMGSVSSGTMRQEDLIPTFVAELESQKPLRAEHRKLANQINKRMEDIGYFESNEAHYDIELLFEALDMYCAPYFYFGGNPGDGADYGYWLTEDWTEQMTDGGGIKVNDLSEIPADHVGEVAVVNDHGNVTLYRRGRNHRLYEVWSIV